MLNMVTSALIWQSRGSIGDVL